MTRTGYEIREGSRILAERFGTLDERQEHPLALPLVEQAGPVAVPTAPCLGTAPLPSPRPAPSGKRAA